MKQKVLITGASGFVGFHLIEAALAKGLDVYAAVRKSSNIAHLTPYNIQYTYPDFTKPESLEKELRQKQYTYIIHAAGMTKARNEEEYNRVNAGYTVNLANAASAYGEGLKKLVFVSSMASIGPSSQPHELIVESKVPQPVTAYGKSKLLAEQQLREINIPLITLRPTAVYGSRDKDIFIILKTFNQGFEPYIGRREQQLSFVYVKDLAKVAVNSLFTSNEANGTYNITDGNCYTRYDLATYAKEILNKKTLKFHLPFATVKGLAALLERTYKIFDKTPALNVEKLGELTAINWCCNIEKAQKHLDFHPAFNLRQGLAETLEWYKTNKWM